MTKHHEGLIFKEELNILEIGKVLIIDYDYNYPDPIFKDDTLTYKKVKYVVTKVSKGDKESVKVLIVKRL